MGTVIFIFVRWSHHFASIYTNQFALNTSAYATTGFPILHLLPIDSSMTGSFNDLVSTYEDQILAPVIMEQFSDQVSLSSLAFPGYVERITFLFRWFFS